MDDCLFSATAQETGRWLPSDPLHPSAVLVADRARGSAARLDLIQGTLDDQAGQSVGSGASLVHGDEFLRHKCRTFANGSREVSVVRLRWDQASPRRPGVSLGLSPVSAEDSRARAARRAKQQIRLRCKSLGVDRLVTLTYRGAQSDLALLKAHFHVFRKSLARANARLSYVAVPERHKSGGLHLHLAVAGYLPVVTVRRLWRSAIAAQGFTGNVDISYNRGLQGAGVTERLSGYISKYVSKALEEERPKGSRSYWSSMGIEIPEAVVTWLDTRDWAVVFREVFEDQQNGGFAVLDYFFVPERGIFWLSATERAGHETGG